MTSYSMASSPRACAVLGCAKLAPCPQHSRSVSPDAPRGPRRKPRNALYGTAAWQRFRLVYLDQHPLCLDCLKAGRHVLATDVHHLRDVRDGGAPFDAANCEALCHACHSRETWQKLQAHTPRQAAREPLHGLHDLKHATGRAIR
jgi:5-methylcytosine-specific restriction protein A